MDFLQTLLRGRIFSLIWAIKEKVLRKSTASLHSLTQDVQHTNPRQNLQKFMQIKPVYQWG